MVPGSYTVREARVYEGGAYSEVTARNVALPVAEALVNCGGRPCAVWGNR